MGYKTIDEVYQDSEENEVKIVIMTFGARKGIKIQAKLLKIMVKFGLGFFSLVGNKKDSKQITDNKEQLSKILDQDIDTSKIDLNQIATLLISELGEDDVLNLIIKLLSSTKINGKPMNNVDMFDDTFSGEYGLLLEVVKKVLEVNFKSFFGNGTIGKILSSIKQNPIVPSGVK